MVPFKNFGDIYFVHTIYDVGVSQKKANSYTLNFNTFSIKKLAI